jgi:hypothetical protein
MVHVGVFKAGWGEMYDWNHIASSFNVVPR